MSQTASSPWCSRRAANWWLRLRWVKSWWTGWEFPAWWRVQRSEQRSKEHPECYSEEQRAPRVLLRGAKSTQSVTQRSKEHPERYSEEQRGPRVLLRGAKSIQSVTQRSKEHPECYSEEQRAPRVLLRGAKSTHSVTQRSKEHPECYSEEQRAPRVLLRGAKRSQSVTSLITRAVLFQLFPKTVNLVPPKPIGFRLTFIQ